MKRFFALILMAALLCGCGAQHLTDTHSTTPPAQTVPIADGLQELQIDVLRTMSPRQMIMMEDGLLLGDASGRLVKLDGQDLTVLADTTIESSELAYVQAVEGGVGICDPGRGEVTLLDPELNVLRIIPCGAGDKTWLLRRDAAEVYTLSTQGIRAYDLSSGAERELLSSRMLSVISISSDLVLLGTVGNEDLMSRYYLLDLTTGALTEATGSVMEGIRKGLCPMGDGSFLRLEREKVTFYDPDGGFLGSCALPGPGFSPGSFLRSEERQGWFLLEQRSDGCALLFFRPESGSEGENVVLTEETVPEGNILPAELYERAEAMSERFDLDIRIADRAERDYTGYDSELLTDPEVTARALDVLEDVLQQYPEGFFTQLKYGDRHIVRIELVDSLSGKEGHDVSSGTSAFTVRRDRYCMIVLNARRIRDSVIFHEFSHVIDDRMAYESRLRPEALYSEDGWMALQPEGFAYADSYQNIGEEVTKFYGCGWFGSNYACVSATEDRAVTMEKGCMADRAVFDANPHLMAKLEYYSACIRDSFDTEGWPRTLPWEQLLHD